jgi:hypothetical protein
MRVFLPFLLTAILLIPTARAKDEDDPRLKDVKKIFINGNSASANQTRKTLMGLPRSVKWKAVCLTGVANRAGADAVLEINETVPLGFWPDGTVRLPQSAGTLTLTNGDLIWSDSSDYSAGFLLQRLNDAVCRVVGKKK